MVRTLALVLVLGTLVAAPAAWAGYAGPFAQQGGAGVLTRDGKFRLVAVGAGGSTTIAKISTRDGTIRGSTTLPGSFGIPVLVPGLAGDGITRDGSVFVVQSMDIQRPIEFRLLRTGDLSTADAFVLNGLFSYDALSPDGSKLFLTKHESVRAANRYVVRAYDLSEHTLLPGRIADRSQKSWIMQGFPTGRTTSPDGRWVYTVYANPEGYPFLHALDTVRGAARCIGLPLAADAPLLKMALRLDGRKLLLQWKRDGKQVLSIDLDSRRVTMAKPSQASFSWPWLVLALAGGSGGAVYARRVRARR